MVEQEAPAVKEVIKEVEVVREVFKEVEVVKYIERPEPTSLLTSGMLVLAGLFRYVAGLF